VVKVLVDTIYADDGSVDHAVDPIFKVPPFLAAFSVS
jgi:hypothetical protein